ncbi:MAG: DUF1648 domain-containing protein [candidate division WOR-3 bacterium]|nr:MAG: DUF1648 domain-containing protein [candidate division WOR-3 bacterium]
MEFKAARLDTVATIATGFVTTLFVGLTIFFSMTMPYGAIFSIPLLIILVVTYLLSPKRYLFEGSKLIIEKVIGKRIVIALDEVEEYVFIPNFTKLKIARTFGNGGLFGYYGLFTTAEYGTINCQLTNLKNVFIIKSKKGTVALSPRDSTQFEEYFKTIVSGITGTVEKLEPRKIDVAKYASPLILLIPSALFILTIVMLVSLYPHLPERIATHFTLSGDPDAWGSKVSFITSGLVPGSILLILNIVLFFIVRRTTVEPIIPNFLVIVLCFIQSFVAYASFDIYWYNKHTVHFIPSLISIIGFTSILTILLIVYYFKIVKKKV